MSRLLYLPALELRSGRYLDSPVVQLACAAGTVSGTLTPFTQRRVTGHLFLPDASSGRLGTIAIVGKSTSAKALGDSVLLAPGGPPTAPPVIKCRWLTPSPSKFSPDLDACNTDCATICDSWRDAFVFKAERRSGNNVVERGLRPPQIGALHAILAHWTVTTEPATIVMPTGTGKTETMLGVLIAERLGRVLVVVPTDSLRDQIGQKFLCLGVLKAAGAVVQSALLPVVGILRRKPKTIQEVDEFFRRCNVVVTTAQIAGGCDDVVSRRIAELCTHLFVDEAHHVRAPTWERVRTSFGAKPVLQFTATPYRGDGKLVDGKVIYNYPLRKAQLDGYFRPIRFRAVEEFDETESDKKIAMAALKQLDTDIAAGFDHLLMARCATIARAEKLHTLYGTLAAGHNPVLAHSEQPAAEKADAVVRLRTRRSRVVVCVDMFGEGFDLPELKIAALHDVHKTLAVTLQFTGRFTRSQSNVGDATVVANVANAEVEEALRGLYGDDPDWNHLLQQLTDTASGHHTLRSEFVQGFTTVPDRIPLQNILPKMSTVVFETQCPRWHPELIETVIKNAYDKPAVHPKEQVLVVVTKEQTPVEWGDVRGLCDTTYDLYIIHWHQAANLLYIHSSDKGNEHEKIAEAVCGAGAKLVRGERVFRVLAGVSRLILTNLGLGHSLSRAVRFTMHVGADIREGLSQAHAQNKYKTNLFARGFAGGDKTTIGCSTKGRLWSFRVAQDIADWVKWCHNTGQKLLDNSINVDHVLDGAMVPKAVPDRPAKAPVTIEWSEDLLSRSEDAVALEFAGVQVPFYEVDLRLLDHNDTGPMRFGVSAPGWPRSADFTVTFAADGVEYTPEPNSDPFLVVRKRKRPLSEYLRSEPPIIRFHDGAFLIYNELFEAPAGPREPFDRSRIQIWNWTGVDLTKESQRDTKRSDSIQRRVIETVLAESGAQQFDVVFDDDESGEAADVVALRLEPERLFIRLYHCKYSKTDAGHRVKDLYEVCGQAQRSVHWKGQPIDLLEHLALRETKRRRAGRVSRFERGDLGTLAKLRRRLHALPAACEIVVVQPGLSVAQAEDAQLELLAVTELYLKETYNATFSVIASA